MPPSPLAGRLASVEVRRRPDGGVEVGFSRLVIGAVSCVLGGAIVFGVVGLRTWSISPMSPRMAIAIGVVGGLSTAGLIAIGGSRSSLRATPFGLAIPGIRRRSFQWGTLEELRWSPDRLVLWVRPRTGGEIRCDASIFRSVARRGVEAVLAFAATAGVPVTMVTEPPPPAVDTQTTTGSLDVRLNTSGYRASSTIVALGCVGFLAVAVAGFVVLEAPGAGVVFLALSISGFWAVGRIRLDLAEPPVMFRLDAQGIWASGAGWGRVVRGRSRSIAWRDLREVRKISRWASALLFASRDDSRPMIVPVDQTELNVQEFLMECRHRADRVNPAIVWPTEGRPR
jgi:hypothetical protein